MKILVLNSGSSSLKFKLLSMPEEQVLAEGQVERLGGPEALLKLRLSDEKSEKPLPNADHKAALGAVIESLREHPSCPIENAKDLAAIGHRVVHGGERFHSSCVIDDAVVDALRQCIPLAPLHNPANITGITEARSLFAEVPQVAVFDTAFHQRMPPEAYRYALPEELYRNHGLRAYGFHGTSHAYVSRRASEMLGGDYPDPRIITAHLGNGASMAAVLGGQSLDTSMGLTPLEGLVMGTRCGDLDPGAVLFLARELDYAPAFIDRLLNRESGLKGLCGESDLREVEARYRAGDDAARLAIRVYCYRIKKYIGAYTAVLGGLDALVFTAGVGENSVLVREVTCEGLEFLGIELDRKANAIPSTEARELQTEESKVKILVVPTDEEGEIARECVALIASEGP